jgi:hypothetical protein
MWNWTELQGESDYDRRQRGTIEFQGEYVARRKPWWLVVGKLAVIALVIGFVYSLVLRHIDYPPLPLSALFFGGLMIYCGLAYVIRPNPNDMNMGWFGGLTNDPTQYSDDINRGLRNLECLVQPGQLVVEAVLDLLILCDLHQAYEPSAEGQRDAAAAEPRTLRPDRFDSVQ